MASPNGTSSGSSSLQISDENDQQHVIDQRKRKRMLSNRESARRSRLRKQKYLDDMTAQVSQLRAQNNQLVTNINAVGQLTLNIVSDNSVLMAQMSELNHRLQALNEIISCMNSNKFSIAVGSQSDHPDYYGDYDYDYDQMIGGGDFLGAWSLTHANQPIMVSAHAIMY